MSQELKLEVPFKPGDKILEIGGGEIPVFRPNFDMRKLPSVDIIGNIEEPWPIEDESYDGIFGKFVIEHVSWRKLPFFISECYRILKPGGHVMMIGPNTLEQCKEIVRLGDITTNCAALIFGGQEEPGWNEHKAALSPNFARELFTHVGFINVKIETWPGQIWTGARTDLYITAEKSKTAPYIKGDRLAWARSKVKANEFVIDLGAGPDKSWKYYGYNVTTVDDNLEFNPDVVSKIEELQLPDKSFDVAILADALEHNDDPRPLLNSAIRLAKKKIVITVPWEARWSENLTPFKNAGHKKFYTEKGLSEILKTLGYSFKTEEIIVDIKYRDGKPPEHWSWVGAVINLEERAQMESKNWYEELDNSLKKRVLDAPKQNTLKIKLNLGTFTVMTKDWINVDILDLSEYAKKNGFNFRQHDLTKGIPCDDDSVDAISSSHLLEHISRKDGENLLKECFRVLKPGSVARIAIPDAKRLAKDYANCDDAPIDFKEKFKYNEGVKNAVDEAEAFWNIVFSGHVTAYDADAMISAMKRVGFEHVCTMKENRSNDVDIEKEIKDMYPDHTSYIEGVKPKQNNVNTIMPQRIVNLSDVQGDAEKQLKIGIISTGFFGCPPKGYSGLEMVVWDLVEGLSALGHKVRLFAPEGSLTPINGELIITGPALQTTQVDWLKAEMNIQEVVAKNCGDLDILHGHNWFGLEYDLHDIGPKICHTHHGHLNPQWWLRIKPPFKLNFIGISEWMKSNYIQQGINSEFVYNGINLDKYEYQETKGDRLLFVGRISQFKQPHVAIELAKRLDLGLDIVGGTFVDDKAYLEAIRSKCDGKQITFNPDVSHEEKLRFMKNAKCLLFPSAMGEPFGLVAAEAMACGTPVIALDDGAISEVVNDGVTGYIMDTYNKIKDLSEFNDRLSKIPPNACRTRVLTMFSRKIMSENYVKYYRKVLSGLEW